MRKYRCLIMLALFFPLVVFAQYDTAVSDSLLKRETPKEYICLLEERNQQMEAFFEMLNIQKDDFSLYLEESPVEKKGNNDEKKRRPSSEEPQSILSYFSAEETTYLYYQTENHFQITANGYYDTYVESPDADIISDETSTLSYRIIPRDKEFCHLLCPVLPKTIEDDL